MQAVLSRNNREGYSRGVGQSQAANVQLSGDAIENIASLVNRSALSEYLTTLFERKAEMISKRADLKILIRKAESGEGFGNEFVLSAENELNGLLTIYADLLTRAREMSRRTAGELHQSLGSPITTGQLLPPGASQILAVAIVLGVFVAVILALILPGRKSEAV
jgi:hypothetical protein